MKYDPQKIEKRWQKEWEAKKVYRADDKSGKPKFYQLETFPYPSAAGLHVGHPKGYIAEDIHARYMRMNGKEVLYTMGWDAFGLPTENYAIKVGKSPQEVAKENVKNFKRQLKMFGFSYDWDREINTSEPEYYKWTQWLFLQLYKTGLAYQKLAKVNWCPQDQTVLANEQIVDGCCERCGTRVIQKDMNQWFFKITDYANRLLDDLGGLDWPEETVKRQKDWVGKSEGAELEFQVANSELKVKVFTTRPDTLFGATYLVLAPEHQIIKNLKPKIKNWNDVDAYINLARKKTELQRKEEAGDKTGVELKDIKAINPANNEEIPIWVADYVLGGYGTGAIMAVPAHDERDFEFAKKFKLPIKPVVLKKTERSYSYVMGIDGEDLRKIGVEIVEKTKDGFFKIKIPFEKLNSYKEFIRDKMSPGFWNEFSTSNGFYFIFKHKDGRLEEMELNEKTNNLIDKYGATFNDQKPSEKPANVYGWLAENSFYKEILIHQDSGVLVNSGKFDGTDSEKAKWEITKFVGGERKTQYKLRDWSVSRQRYWGVPIPIIYCKECGTVPVSEDELPLKLPKLKDYRPKGMPPLASSEKWLEVKCPKCGGEAKRSPETLDTFVDSSWYYLAYAMRGISNFQFPISNYNVAIDYWLPVDLYVIGAEHVTAHLLYARFMTKFLFDEGYLNFKEPFLKLRHQGMILGPDGRRMSKRRGNVINPDDVIAEYGADAARMYEMFMGPFEDGQPWDTKGVVGVYRFLKRIWDYFKQQGKEAIEDVGGFLQDDNENLSLIFNSTIKKVGDDILELKFNTAVSALMVLLNNFQRKEEHLHRTSTTSSKLSKNQMEIFLKLLAPFAPHIAEELWVNVLGNKESIHLEEWPKYDENVLAEEKTKLIVQINGKTRDTIEVKKGLSEDAAKELALTSEKIKKHISNEPKKVIYVPDRVINLVI